MFAGKKRFASLASVKEKRPRSVISINFRYTLLYTDRGRQKLGFMQNKNGPRCLSGDPKYQ